MENFAVLAAGAFPVATNNNNNTLHAHYMIYEEFIKVFSLLASQLVLPSGTATVVIPGMLLA